MTLSAFQNLPAEGIINDIDRDPSNRGQDTIVHEFLEQAKDMHHHDTVIAVCAHIALNVDAELYRKANISPFDLLKRCVRETASPVSRCTAYHAILLQDKDPKQKAEAAAGILKNIAWHPDFDELCFYLCDVAQQLPQTSFTRIQADVLLFELTHTFDGKTSELQKARTAWRDERYSDLNEHCCELGRFVHLSGTENTKTILTFASALFECPQTVTNISVRYNVGEEILSKITESPYEELAKNATQILNKGLSATQTPKRRHTKDFG